MPSRRQQIISSRSALLGDVISHHPREFVAIVMAILATLAIFFNALFMQHGPISAPLFATRPLPTREKAMRPLTKREAALPTHLPEARPAILANPAPSQAQITTAIQRALSRRNLYDGAIDGIWGAKTEAAAHIYLKATGLKIKAEPSEALLRLLTVPTAKAAKTKTTSRTPVNNDPVATTTAPSKRMLAIQHALTDFGYGQIKPTGVYNAETRAAIEKFQRDRGLQVDGEVTDGFVHALASMTGRSLE